ncbi:MAG: hypothetical protein K2N73_16270 [Lachnospiraceae bacterium]|nr:hypothetical protein [Lachnospiraceae bacterium]
MGGLASVAFYGAGKAVEALKRGVERRRIQKIENYVIDAANKRAQYLLETSTQTAVGPCLSTIYDPKLKRLYYGLNYKSKSVAALAEYDTWHLKETHEIIRTRTAQYDKAIQDEIIKNLPSNYDRRLAAHSEVRALDQALKAREEAGMPVNESIIAELYLYNLYMPTRAMTEGQDNKAPLLDKSSYFLISFFPKSPMNQRLETYLFIKCITTTSHMCCA